MEWDWDSVPELQSGTGYTIRIGKIRRFFLGWRQGREDHFPICCILRWSVEDVFNDGKVKPSGKYQGSRRGSFAMPDGTRCVPCNVFHRKDEEQE
jgi:hypothetical protein